MLLENNGGFENEVYDLTVDAVGNIYVTDGHDSISKYSENGSLIQKLKRMQIIEILSGLGASIQMLKGIFMSLMR